MSVSQIRAQVDLEEDRTGTRDIPTNLPLTSLTLHGCSNAIVLDDPIAFGLHANGEVLTVNGYPPTCPGRAAAQCNGSTSSR